MNTKNEQPPIILEDHPNCGTEDCCGECETATKKEDLKDDKIQTVSI